MMVIIVVVRLSILLLLMLIDTLLFILMHACDLITKVTCKVIREITFSFNYFCFKKNV